LKWGNHPNISCDVCHVPIGEGARFLCLICPSFNTCEACEPQESAKKIHRFVKIWDSRELTDETIARYREKADKIFSVINPEPNNDSFAFHKSKNYCHLKNDENALNLVKEMLRRENTFRLSKEYLDEYAKSQDDDWKTDVTERIQIQVVNEFLPKAGKYFTNVEDGIDFLRGAVGNFPEHVEELMECANYVKYTQCCVRGDLVVGDVVDGSKIPIYNPYTLEKEYLSDYFSATKPTVIIGSSYT